jgi:hypothetical protein
VHRNLITFLALSLFYTFFSTSAVLVKADDTALDPYCPPPTVPGLVSICGVLRQAFPKTVTVDGQDKLITAKGVPNVSVYLYEFNPINSTGKIDGALTHPFAFTTTTENDSDGFSGGHFRIFARARSGSTVRYLVFSCSGKIAGMKMIPSYQTLPNIVDYVDCPDQNVAIAPPETLKYVVNPDKNLSCDQAKQDTAGNATTIQLDRNQAVKAVMNESLNLDNADARFIGAEGSVAQPINQNGPAGAFFTTLADAGEKAFVPGKAWVKGGFWSEDCTVMTGGNDPVCQKVALLAGANSVLNATNQKQNVTNFVEAYTKELYENADFVVRNFLPTIPPSNVIQFYKDLTAQQDETQYVQNPSAAAQFLHTNFGNCVGSVFLRNDGDTTTVDQYPDCDQFKRCNQVMSDSGDIVNTFTTNGYGKSMSYPTTLDPTTSSYLSTIDMSTKVCSLNGNAVTIGQLIDGYKSGSDLKQYYNPELLVFYGQQGATAKVGQQIESVNDSFMPYAKSQGRDAPIVPMGEGHISQKAGTSVVFNNGGKANNNSMVSAACVTGSCTSGTQTLTDVYKIPYSENANNLVTGPVVGDIGDNNRVLCLDSKENDPTRPNVVTADIPTTETQLKKDNKFAGNIGHYDPQGIGQPLKDDSVTPTSAEFLTTAAKNRQQWLKQYTNSLGTQGLFPSDVYDSLLTVASGEGDIAKSSAISNNALTAFWDAALGALSSNNALTKTFFDRKYDKGTPMLRDDIVTSFPLSEANFMDLFTLPANDSKIVSSDWGGSASYPWHTVSFGSYCGGGQQLTSTQDVSVGGSNFKITRTCKIGTEDGEGIGPDKGKTDCVLAVWKRSHGCHWTGASCVNGGTNESFSAGTSCTTNVQRAQVAADQRTALSYDTLTGFSVDKEWLKKGKMAEPKPGDCSSTSFTACTQESHSDTKTYPVGVVSVAGPYISVGSTQKPDAVTSITQKSVESDIPSLDVNAGTSNVDSITVADNARYNQWKYPYSTQVQFGKVAQVSASTSVNKNDPNQTQTKGKDTQGFGGGATGNILQQFALPTDFTVGQIDYPDVQYECASTELGSSGTWKCPVSATPKDADIAAMATQIGHNDCKLNVTPACLSSLGISDNLSTTFQVILNKAGSDNQIPAAAILTYMAGLSSGSRFQTYASSLFNSANEQTLVAASSPWYGRMPDCDDSDTGAEGPFDWLTPYFYTGINAAKDSSGGLLIDDLPAIGGGTTKGRGDKDPDTKAFYASKCNFLDATYATAGSIRSYGGSCGSNINALKTALLALWATDGMDSWLTSTGNTIFTSCGGAH